MGSTPNSGEGHTRRYASARLVLAGSMLVMGVAGMIYEYALSALGNNLIGSSHEQIFVIIGLMMFAMGVGAAVQPRIRPPLLDKFLWIEILLGVIGGLSGLIVYTAYGYMASYEVVLYAVALVIGLLVGFEVPLLIRINESYAGELRSNLGQILSMDYIGSLGGALLFAYVLLSRVPLAQISLAVGLVSVAVAGAGLWYFWSIVRRPRLILVGVACAAGVLAAAWWYAGAWTAAVEQRTYEDPIVFRDTSVYQHAVLTERGDHTRLYINGHLQFSSRDEAIYHELLVHPAMLAHGGAERVLILGGGDGLALREVLKHGSVREVVLVDIDPMITRLGAEHPRLIEMNRGSMLDARVSVLTAAGITPGESITPERPSTLRQSFLSEDRYAVADVRAVHVDAEVFLRGLPSGERGFDVAICDFPDPRSVGLAKLYSVGFYTRLRDVLSPDGLVAVQSTSPYHAAEVFVCIGKTLREAGLAATPYRQNVPSFGEWGWHIAAADGRRVSGATFRGLETMPVAVSYLTPGVLRGAFEFGRGWFDGAGSVRANTQMRPVILDYDRRSWRR
ncbi:MAG: polyamine aminopropyltransferase [Bacteroidota bacterium]